MAEIAGEEEDPGGGGGGGGPRRTRGTPASRGAKVDESSVSVVAAGGDGVAEGLLKREAVAADAQGRAGHMIIVYYYYFDYIHYHHRHYHYCYCFVITNFIDFFIIMMMIKDSSQYCYYCHNGDGNDDEVFRKLTF